MSDLQLIFLAYLINLGAMISPGPDFLMVLRSALRHGSRAGMFTAMGIAAGIGFHISYCMAGVALLISRSIILFNAIKWIGAGYLVYVGWHSLRSKGMDPEAMKMPLKIPGQSGRSVSALQSFRAGLVTNIFNPKATMFFMALFSPLGGLATLPPGMRALLAGLFIVTPFLWFSAVAFVMTTPSVRNAYVKASKWIDRVFGGFFIALGARLALTRL